MKRFSSQDVKIWLGSKAPGTRQGLNIYVLNVNIYVFNELNFKGEVQPHDSEEVIL